MPKLPIIKPKKLIQLLKKMGFTVDRIHGSHWIMYRDDRPFPIVIPMHNRELKPGTLQSILHTADISITQLNELL